MGTKERPRVLCVDDDRDVAEVVQAILQDEGYEVTCLYDVSGDNFQRVVGQVEPDCVLLDGAGAEFGTAWIEAAFARERRRPVPVVMFTAHAADALEAEVNVSTRAQAAGFTAVLRKPFHLDELVGAVESAVGRSQPFLHTAEAEAQRTRELVAALERAGARDVQPARRREWVTFTNQRGELLQLYWWQARGVFQVGRFLQNGRLKMLGQFVDRDAAIDVALH